MSNGTNSKSYLWTMTLLTISDNKPIMVSTEGTTFDFSGYVTVKEGCDLDVVAQIAGLEFMLDVTRHYYCQAAPEDPSRATAARLLHRSGFSPIEVLPHLTCDLEPVEVD